MASRLRVPATHRRGFDSFVMLITWQLWKHRNGLVFGQLSSPTSVLQLSVKIFEELNTWRLAGGRGVSSFCE